MNKDGYFEIKLQDIKAVDIDEDGLVTVEFEGNEYTIDLNDIEKIEF
jgi:hypothetical protein